MQSSTSITGYVTLGEAAAKYGTSVKILRDKKSKVGKYFRLVTTDKAGQKEVFEGDKITTTDVLRFQREEKKLVSWLVNEKFVRKLGKPPIKKSDIPVARKDISEVLSERVAKLESELIEERRAREDERRRIEKTRQEEEEKREDERRRHSEELRQAMTLSESQQRITENQQKLSLQLQELVKELKAPRLTSGAVESHESEAGEPSKPIKPRKAPQKRTSERTTPIKRGLISRVGDWFKTGYEESKKI